MIINNRFSLGIKEIVRAAVQEVITDGGFEKDAITMAEKFLEWSAESENQVAFGHFAEDLISQLENCFKPHECFRRSRR